MMIGPRDYPAPENDNGEQEYEEASTAGENDDEDGFLRPDGNEE